MYCLHGWAMTIYQCCKAFLFQQECIHVFHFECPCVWRVDGNYTDLRRSMLGCKLSRFSFTARDLPNTFCFLIVVCILRAIVCDNLDVMSSMLLVRNQFMGSNL